MHLIRRILVGGGVLALASSGLAFAGVGLPDQASSTADDHVSAVDDTTTTTEAETDDQAGIEAETEENTSVDAEGGPSVQSQDSSEFGQCVSDMASSDSPEGDYNPAVECWDGDFPGGGPETLGAEAAADHKPTTADDETEAEDETETEAESEDHGAEASASGQDKAAEAKAGHDSTETSDESTEDTDSES